MQTFSFSLRLKLLLLIYVASVVFMTVKGQASLPHSKLCDYARDLMVANKKDEAIAYLLKEKSGLELQSLEETSFYLDVLYSLGIVYRSSWKLEEAQKCFQAAISLHDKIDPEGFWDEIDLWENLAFSYGYQDFPKAIPLLEKAMEARILRYGDNGYGASLDYNRLGSYYYNIGYFEKATEYVLKSIRVLKEIGKTQYEGFAGVQLLLGSIYQRAGNPEEALEFYKQLLLLLEPRYGNHRVTARCLSAIGDTYAKTGDAEAALKYQFLAAAMFEKVDSTYLPGCYISLARAYNIAYQPLNAIHYLQRARYFGKRPGENAPLYAGLAFQLCDAYLQLNDHQQALAFIDSTLEILKNRKGLNRFNYRKAMLVKANILSKYMQSGEKDAVVKETDELIQTAQGIMASIISEITNTSDKLVIYSEAVKGMDLTITTYTQLFEATGDVKWLKKAFEFSEISKGLILYQHVLENKSRRQVAVPKPLADQEKSVHDLITDAEKRKYELGPKASSEENDNVQDQIFQLKKQYESIQNNIRAVCGDYFQEAGTFPAPQFDSLQRVLSPNEGLLEFFVGDSSISIFLMRRDTFVFRKIDHRVAVEKRIAQLRESICRYALSPRKNNDIYLAAASDYVESAYGLHHLLLAPFGKLLPARLTIVPDGRVAYLPFEALLVEKPDRPDRFHLHHYLFRDFTIRYASSATLLQEMGNLPPALPNSGRLLAMAPFFDGSTVWDDSLRAMQADFNRSVAAPLPYSGEEVFKVAKITRGFVCTGANASKNTFIQEAPKYRVLHLATHAQANMVTGDFSFLAFAPYHGYPNGERMYVSEIYGLKLNTELVTLSACETGLGQIYQGEGIVSIARAFAAAGAHSILESQWAVNDAQTRFLMELFYQNLKKRKSKDVALQNAQRAYLSMFQGENAHPYYWAGFILMGDNRPLSLF